MLLEKFKTRNKEEMNKDLSSESYLQSSLLVMYFLVRMVTEPSTMVLATSLQKIYYSRSGRETINRRRIACMAN